MGADISWELDLWGRLRDQRGASAAGAEAAQEDLYAAQLSLAGTTVKSALTLAETRAQIQLSEENIATRRINLGVLEKQLDRGIDTEQVALDVSLARADLARAEATLASRKREADEARRGLELLLGAYPAGKEHGWRICLVCARTCRRACLRRCCCAAQICGRWSAAWNQPCVRRVGQRRLFCPASVSPALEA